MTARLALASAAALALAGNVVSAKVVWSEDFTGETDGAAPTNNFPGGFSGQDWGAPTNNVSNGTVSLAVSTAEGNAAPSLLLNDQSTGNTTFVGTNFSQHAPYNMQTAGEETLRWSFDIRYDALGNMTAGTNTMLRTFLRESGSSTNAIAVAFGRGQLADGDSNDDVFLVVGKGDAPQATAANAVGFTGSGWAPGFDFGDWSTTDADNDTDNAFYHFELSFTQGVKDVTIRAWPVANPAQAITFTRTLDNALSFSNSGTHGMSVQSASAARGTMYLDNIEFTSVPEPAALSLLGLAGFGLARRRRV